MTGMPLARLFSLSEQSSGPSSWEGYRRGVSQETPANLHPAFRVRKVNCNGPINVLESDGFRFSRRQCDDMAVIDALPNLVSPGNRLINRSG